MTKIKNIDQQDTNLNKVYPNPRLKVCGMNYNTAEVAQLQPDYLGFIFYEKSPRNFKGKIPNIPDSIKRVGVFVDANLDDVVHKINEYGLNAVQLHGNESAEYCEKLRSICHSDPETSGEESQKIPPSAGKIQLIKVFSIKDKFNFDNLKPYEGIVDYFLFDTKGKLPGGNGFTFNWNVLENYPSTTPYFLSGGIGLDEIENLKAFNKSPASKHCYAIDVNSKFEIEPGLKNIEALEKFKKQLSF